MMKIIITSVLICCCSMRILAQFAIGLEVEGHFYQKQERPPTISSSTERSVGQILSLPAIGPKFWFGDWEVWTISLEAKAGISPFSLDFDEYKGMGSLAFPIIAKFNIDPTLDDGTFKIGVGGGVQWNITELYAIPNAYKGLGNTFFITYIGEISAQLVLDTADWGEDGDEGVSLEFFIRGGGSPQGALSFGFGLKLNYRIHLRNSR